MCLNLRHFVFCILCHFITDPQLFFHYLNKSREARIEMVDPGLTKIIQLSRKILLLHVATYRKDGVEKSLGGRRKGAPLK